MSRLGKKRGEGGRWYRCFAVSLSQKPSGVRSRGTLAATHNAHNMCWRQVTRFQKTVLIVLIYITLYYVVSFIATPQPVINFVDDEVRIGDKYVFMYLVSKSPVFSDVEGADVFKKRECGMCFITNNKGFMPISEFDAVLVHGEKKLLEEQSAFMDPSKRYLIETSQTCLAKKLEKCSPRITSFSTRYNFELCSLCDYLQKRRQKSLD